MPGPLTSPLAPKAAPAEVDPLDAEIAVLGGVRVAASPKLDPIAEAAALGGKVLGPEDLAKDATFDPVAHFRRFKDDPGALDLAAQVMEARSRGVEPPRDVGASVKAGLVGGVKMITDQAAGLGRIGVETLAALNPDTPDFRRNLAGSRSAAALEAAGQAALGPLSSALKGANIIPHQPSAELKAKDQAAAGREAQRALDVARTSPFRGDPGRYAQQLDAAKAAVATAPKPDLQAARIEDARRKIIDQAALADARDETLAGRGVVAEATGQATPEQLAGAGVKLDEHDWLSRLTGSSPIQQMATAADPNLLAFGLAMNKLGAPLANAVSRVPGVGPLTSKVGDLVEGVARGAAGIAPYGLGKVAQGAGKVLGSEAADATAGAAAGVKAGLAAGSPFGPLGMAAGAAGGLAAGGALGAAAGRSALMKSVGGAIERGGARVAQTGADLAAGVPGAGRTAANLGDILGGTAREAAKTGAQGALLNIPLAAVSDDPWKTVFEGVAPGLAFGLVGLRANRRAAREAAADALAVEGAARPVLPEAQAAYEALGAPDRAAVDLYRGLFARIQPGLDVVPLGGDAFATAAAAAGGRGGERGFFQRDQTGRERIVLNADHPEMFGATAHESGHSMVNGEVSRLFGEATQDRLARSVGRALFEPQLTVEGQPIPDTFDLRRPTQTLRDAAGAYSERMGRQFDPENPQQSEYIANEILAETTRSLTSKEGVGAMLAGPMPGERGVAFLRDRLADIFPGLRRNFEDIGARELPRVTSALRDALGEIGTAVRERTPASQSEGGPFSLAARFDPGGLALPALSDVRAPAQRPGPLTSPITLPSPTPASVPLPAPAPITRPLTGERPGTPPEPAAATPAPSGAPSVAADALAALRKLGFAEAEAQKRIDKALSGGTYADAADLVRDALKSGETPARSPLTDQPLLKPSADRGQAGPLTSPLPERPRETAPPPAAEPPPAPKVSHPLSREEVVALERDFTPPPYKPRTGTPEEKAAKIEARRQEAVERELWTQHAAKVEPGDNRVTLRVDERTGRAEVRGQRIDAEDPVHQRLLAENIIAPGVLEPMLAAIAAKTPVTIDYLSAPKTRDAKTAAARREAQAESPAQERADGAPATIADKSILPSGFFVSKDGKLYVRGFSLDKFLSNSETLLRVMADAGIPVPFKSVNDPALVKAFQVYTQNHAGGWKGDGSARLQPTEAVTVPAGPKDFKPTPLPKEVADFLNLAAANEGAKTKGPRGAEVREFAETNANPPTEAGEVNPLREQLERSGFLKEGPLEMGTDPTTGEAVTKQAQDAGAKNVFESTSETIMAELIERAAPGAPAPAKTNLRATEFSGERAGLVEKGRPNSNFVAAGFLPAKGGPLTSQTGAGGKIERAASAVAERTGLPSIRIADLVRESGMPAEGVRAFLQAAAKRGEVSLEAGNWPDATPEERAAAVEHLGQKRLYVRFGAGGGEESSAKADGPLSPFRAPQLSRPAAGGFSFADKFKRP